MSDQMSDLAPFRAEVANWLSDNFPQSLKGQGISPCGGFEGEAEIHHDAARWRDRVAFRGFLPPSWPAGFFGGGFILAEARFL